MVDKEIARKIGRIINDIRNNLNLDASAFGAIFGLTGSTIKNYETGVTEPTVSTFYKILEYRGGKTLPQKVYDGCINCHQPFDKRFAHQTMCDSCKKAKAWARFINNIDKKYGEQLIHDICDLRCDWNITLQSVADKYDISRERIRQLYRKLMGVSYSNREKFVHEKPLVCVNHPYHKAAAFKGKKPRSGSLYEKMFWDLCLESGYSVSVYKNSKIDMVINGHSVDVKGCSKPFFMSKHNKTGYYRYGISKYQCEKADFIACFHSTEDCFFIIPTKEIPKTCNNRILIYISEHETNYYNTKNRYWEYRDRLDLLAKPKTTDTLRAFVEKGE